MSNPFEAEIQASCKHLKIYYERLPLPPRLGEVILKKNPYDGFMVCPRMGFTALEMKSQEEHGTFSLSRVKEHQVEGLYRVLDHGYQAYLLVNMRRTRVTETRRKRDPLTKKLVPVQVERNLSRNQCWALDFRRWEELKGSLTYKNGKPRASVPRELFDNPDWFLPIPRVPVVNEAGEKETVWDLRVISERVG